MGRVFIHFPHGATSFGGVDRVNHTIAGILQRHFEVVDDPAGADLQVCANDWNVPAPPRRLFIDHGSFADAGFWAYTAPKLERSDAILVTSRVCERVADRLFADERPRLHRVPLFVDTDLFRPASDRAVGRRELADEGLVPGEGPLLLAVSAYSRRKNLHLAIRLLADVRRHLPGARLVLVGHPTPSQRDYARQLEDLTRELDLVDAVHFIQTMQHARLAGLMAAADLFVHLTTCRLENFGLVVGEALAAGLPVVAADWGGLRDLVTPDRTGVLAPTWLTVRGPRVDWRGAAVDAARLLADEPRLERMRRQGATFAADELSEQAFERRLCAAVRHELRDDAPPRSPVRLSPRGEDLMFATIRLHMERSGIRSASEEYRAMLDADAELCRFLTGPAATREDPPRVRSGAPLYPVVSSRVEDDAVRIMDPAWEGRLPISPDLRTAVEDAAGASEEARQILVDLGLLAPLREA
jgi:glycosyltransferase involved in cell wall biosynthesis